MSDLQTRNAEFSVTGATDDISVIEGRAPAATIHGYQREVISYTRGVGTISCVSDGYEPCHNSEQVTASVGYDPEGDLENPPHSVFCANGAGFTVPWTEVDSYKHLEADVTLTEGAEVMIPKVASLSRRYSISEKEIEQIMLRTFGQPKKRVENEPKRMSFSEPEKHIPKKVREKKQSMTIIDGYNVIYAFKELRSVSAVNLEKARQVLDDILANYVAYTKREVTLVYDAYRVKHGTGSDNTKNGYRTVFTAENETADAYIEKMMQRLGPNYNIRVVTDDRLLQFSAVHSGISRMTAEEFEEEIIKVGQEITEYIKNHTK
jgi:predicted RNA-binding protein with PIN domain